MKFWRRKNDAMPNPLARFCGGLHGLADNPDVVEGQLRDALRSAAKLLASQDRLIATLTRGNRRLLIQLTLTTLLWMLMVAFDLYRRHWEAT